MVKKICKGCGIEHEMKPSRTFHNRECSEAYAKRTYSKPKPEVETKPQRFIAYLKRTHPDIQEEKWILPYLGLKALFVYCFSKDGRQPSKPTIERYLGRPQHTNLAKWQTRTRNGIRDHVKYYLNNPKKGLMEDLGLMCFLS